MPLLKEYVNYSNYIGDDYKIIRNKYGLAH
jgi:hypothetical protein